MISEELICDYCDCVYTVESVEEDPVRFCPMCGSEIDREEEPLWENGVSEEDWD
jgi:rRNA maturation endonuclease Nob1